MNVAQVADTIRRQLGGSRFVAMTGAKRFGYGEDQEGQPFLSFAVGQGAKTKEGKQVTHVRVTYIPGQDVYTMEFFWCRGVKMILREEVKDVYAYDLRPVFTENTGFYTSMKG